MDKIREAKTKVEYTGERIIKKKDGKLTAMEYCEKHYPKMMKEYKAIMWKQYETFCRKQRNYGPHNISVGTSLETEDDIKLSLTGLWFRLNDKIQRLKQLVVLRHPDEVDESIEDTFQDLSIYGMIAQIVKNGKWGK
jgi:hypothetical protein